MTDVLQELRDKVSARANPRERDFEILQPATQGARYARVADDALRAYRGSLDAAKALHEALLPGWVVGIHKPPDPSNHEKCALFWIVNLGTADGKVEIDSVIGADPARAWLLAILDALIQGDKADG